MRTPKPRRVWPLGHRLWRNFLLQNKIGPNEAAKALKTTHVTVITWRDQKATPEREMRTAISVYTHGEVPEESWLTEEDKERKKELSAVRPYGSEEVGVSGPSAFQVKPRTRRRGPRAA